MKCFDKGGRASYKLKPNSKKAGDCDWKITLSWEHFPWETVAFKHYSPRVCYEQYWSLIGLSERKFKAKVLNTQKAKDNYEKIMQRKRD